MKNLYDGMVETDSQGQAEIVLPDWFEALNEAFRYQLTAVGAQSPDLHVARGVKDGSFTIAGAEPGTAVCWQVTGVRHDPFARDNPLEVEVAKAHSEVGLYLHAESYGVPAERSLTTLIHPDAK